MFIGLSLYMAMGLNDVRICYIATSGSLRSVIQKEPRDPFGGNVYYVAMPITFVRNVICIAP